MYNVNEVMVVKLYNEEKSMQDGELIYRFRKILELMQSVGKMFLSADGWKEFESISQIFVQRFRDGFPVECRIINTYTMKIVSHKKYSFDELHFIRYMIDMISEEFEDKEKHLNKQKPKKVFISHAQDDMIIVEKLVDLLSHIGLNRNTLFCSSIPGYNIRQGSGDIFDYLRAEFESNNLFVIFMLSKNYYDSVACLNEMGAAWILQNQYQTILLPGFDFKDIEGAINPRNISFKLSDKMYRMEAMAEFKDNIINFLQLDPVDSSGWDYYRQRFFDEIDRI